MWSWLRGFSTGLRGVLLLLFTYIAATTIHLFAFSFEFMPTYVVYGETMETVSDFMFLGSKITADGDAAMKLKDTDSLEGKL